MKQKNFDSSFNCRLPTALLVHAKEVANMQGVGIAAFTRQALRRNIKWVRETERRLFNSEESTP